VMEKREMGPDSVSAIGLGAMRFGGANLFGPPANRDEAIALPRAAVQLNSDHIDMSQYYGLVIVSDPLRDAVHRYLPGMLLSSQVGSKRCKRVPGTSSLRHQRQNLAPTSVRLDSRAFQLISPL
jgi:aryl-alcohol dehydrogenase-like predicted oxidoreductase